MENYVFAAGTVEYISINQLMISIKTNYGYIPALLKDISIKLHESIVITGTLDKKGFVIINTCKKQKCKSVALIIIKGKINKGKNYPILVSIGKEIINPRLINIKRPNNKSILNSEIKLITLDFNQNMKLKVLFAVKI